MEKTDILNTLKKKGNLSLRELLTALAEVLPGFVPAQPKYGVSACPDERTIRFYMAGGLVDRPEKFRGAAALFSYRHILQVLSVKHLQSEYLPLKKIKAMLSGMSSKEMEDILLGDMRPDAVLGSAPLSCSSEKISARKNRFMVQETHNMLSESAGSFPTVTEGRIKQQSEEWLRVWISDDVEINIKSASLPCGKQEQRKFIEKLSAKLSMFIETENRGHRHEKDG